MNSEFDDEDELALVEKNLFRSLGADEPSASARRLVASGLGLGAFGVSGAVGAAGAIKGIGAGAAAGAGTAAAASGGAAAAAGAASASLWSTGLISMLQWAGVGIATGTISIAAWQYGTRGTRKNPPSASLSTAIAEVSPAAAQQGPLAKGGLQARNGEPLELPAPKASAPPEDPPELAGKTRSVALPAAPPPKTNVASDLSTASPSSLAGEIALLDRTRAALAKGDAARAKELLGRYARDFPAGTLSVEATVLRIENLFLEGDSGAAAALARGFLAAHGTSTHASRVRRLLADHEKP